MKNYFFRKLMIVLVVSSLIILPFETISGNTKELELNLETRFNTYFLGEIITINLYLKNTSSVSQILEFPTSQLVDSEIYLLADSQTQKLLYRWSEGKAFLQVITRVELKPGENRQILTYDWDTSLSKLPVDKPLKLLVKGIVPDMRIRPEKTLFLDLIPPAGGVRDIRSHYGEKEIRDMLASGLFKLNHQNSLNPELPISRGEFFYVLATILKLPWVVLPYSPFRDVSPGHKYIQEILALHAQDIINGYPDNTLRPENNLTRAETSVLLTLALKLCKPLEINFSDVPTNHWAYVAIGRMVNANLMVGIGNNRFAPDKPLTRGQAAIVLMKVKKIMDSQPL